MNLHISRDHFVSGVYECAHTYVHVYVYIVHGNCFLLFVEIDDLIFSHNILLLSERGQHEI